MREPERIPRILEKIGRLWQRFPDCRFGQFCAIINEQMVARGLPVQVVTDRQRQAFDPFYLEDNLFEAVLDELLGTDV